MSAAGPVSVPRKTYLTAAVIIPPADAWEPIQRIRRVHDPQVGRWMPHITMLYPFLPEAAFEEVAAGAASACGGHRPFALTLAEFRYFLRGRRSATLWLDPGPGGPLADLQADLQRAFPHCDDVSRFPGGFTPHLSVGRFAGEAEVEAARERFRAEWVRLEFLVDRVCLIARSGRPDDPFAVKCEVPLGEEGLGTER